MRTHLYVVMLPFLAATATAQFYGARVEGNISMVAQSDGDLSSYSWAQYYNSLNYASAIYMQGDHSIRSPQGLIDILQWGVDAGEYAGTRTGRWEYSTTYTAKNFGTAYPNGRGTEDGVSGGPWTASVTSPSPPTATETPEDPRSLGGPHNVVSEPLILDLDGDGIETTSLEDSPVAFDISGNGRPDLTAWTSPTGEDAFLYRDLDHDGVPDDGGELFGTATRGESGDMAANGFAALADYDVQANGGNGDGVISPLDGVWGMMRLWVDRNHDGRLSHDENFSLAERGVVEISLAYRTLTAAEAFGRDAAGNWHLQQSTFKRRMHGRVVESAIHDLYFRAFIY